MRIQMHISPHTSTMFALVLLALVAQAFAGEYIDARCPVVRPVDNFDYASFSNGIWYEVGRYDNRKEKGTECSYSIFTPMGDRFKIENIGLRPSFSSENELSWIVSRTKTLRSDFKALIDRYLLESKVLDLSKYIFPDFSDNVCRIDF
ncbi:bilin-binding protein [Danaus plexippus plexippus]|uniref:Bilin-binding protein n=1 Tax=Danaus plexippus plexippus TaxID=278856 RepID=A0A212EXH1_DANPL|nr:bilin-binding protein [Danaus plexippus plexippus]